MAAAAAASRAQQRRLTCLCSVPGVVQASMARVPSSSSRRRSTNRSSCRSSPTSWRARTTSTPGAPVGHRAVAQRVTRPRSTSPPTLSYGVMGNVSSVPAGFKIETVLTRPLHATRLRFTMFVTTDHLGVVGGRHQRCHVRVGRRSAFPLR